MSSDVGSASTTGTMSLHAAKQQRKALERDTSLLANRIRLLQIEEQRTRKKIEETRKKTQTVLNNKQRLEDRHQEKQQVQAFRQNQLADTQARAAALREQRKLNRKDTAQAILEQRRTDYTYGRDLKNYCLNQKNHYRKMTQENNYQKRTQVRNKSLEATHRMQKLQSERIQNFSNNYWQQVDNEDAKAKEVERQILEMELLEMELIKKLQNTQMVQKSAYQELEEALSYQPNKASSVA